MLIEFAYLSAYNDITQWLDRTVVTLIWQNSNHSRYGTMIWQNSSHSRYGTMIWQNSSHSRYGKFPNLNAT